MFMQRRQHATAMVDELCRRGDNVTHEEMLQLQKLLHGEEALPQVTPMWMPSQSNVVGPSQHRFFQ